MSTSGYKSKNEAEEGSRVCLIYSSGGYIYPIYNVWSVNGKNIIKIITWARTNHISFNIRHHEQITSLHIPDPITTQNYLYIRKYLLDISLNQNEVLCVRSQHTKCPTIVCSGCMTSLDLLEGGFLKLPLFHIAIYIFFSSQLSNSTNQLWRSFLQN